MLLSPSGIIDIANGFNVTSMSVHSAWPGTDGADNEISGATRQTFILPAATTTPTRSLTSPLTWTIGDYSPVAFFVLWAGSTPKAIAVNGGSEIEVKRILTTGVIFCPQHGLSVGNRVVALGGWPLPFVEGNLYYVKSATPDTLTLAASLTDVALAPSANNSNTSMLLSKIVVEEGGPGQFTLTRFDLTWRWTDTGGGTVVPNPEPTGYRWKSDRPIPPQEISLQGGDSPYSILQHLTGGTTTSLKLVSGQAELNALGITFNETQGTLVPAASLTPGVVDIVFRASNDVIVDYTGSEFYVRVFTDRQWMPRDDSGSQHQNTGYGLGAGYWNDPLTRNGVTGKYWSGHYQRTGIQWDYRTDFDPTAIGTLTFTTSTSVAVGSEWTIDVTQAVKDYAAQTKRNHGFLIRALPPTATGIKRFHHRENSNASFRPRVVITGDAPTTLIAESDGNLTDTDSVDGATRLAASYSKNTTTGAETIQSFYVWFGFQEYFDANGITDASQITQALLKLNIESTSSGNATYSVHHMRPGGMDYWSIPTPRTGIAWPGSSTAIPGVKVGLRDENIEHAVDENGERCVLFADNFTLPPDTKRYRLFYAQNKSQAYPDDSAAFTPGDIITGDDNEFPSICTMQAMYPTQKSLRWYWNAWNSPIGHCHWMAAPFSNPNALGPRLQVKSIGADGLFTLVNTYADSGSSAFGRNPFGSGGTAYPHGFNPVYIAAGKKMALPSPFVQQPKYVTQGGVVQNQQAGPPYYVMCVSSPGNNTFYLTDTPFGNPIIPAQAVNSDPLTFTSFDDYILLTPPRRLPTTPAKLVINSVAKKTDGTYYFPASAKYDYNGTSSMPEFYFRAYFFVPTTFRLHTQGAKQMWGGVDAQYNHIRGMGMGNGGSEGEGIAGCTIRGHSEIQAPIPLTQESNTILLTAYTYTMHGGQIDANGKVQMNGAYDIFLDSSSTSNFGETFNFNTKAGMGLMEKGRWYCIEWHAKTNTLVPNTDPIFIGDNVTPNYNCIINGQVQPCPTGYACYNPIHAIRDTSIDPVTGRQRNPFGGPYPNTFRSPIDLPATWARTGAPTFKYSYTDERQTPQEYELFGPTQNPLAPWAGSFFAIDQAAASIGGNVRAHGDKDYRRAIIERLPTKAKIKPGGGGDGLYEVWVNGRQVYRNDTVYFRHVDVLKDGITPYLLMGPMLYTQVGGVDRDFFECYTYMTHAVLSTRYIGPMKLS